MLSKQNMEVPEGLVADNPTITVTFGSLSWMQVEETVIIYIFTAINVAS